MVRRLGLRRVAYDWRAKHVESFEEEIVQYKKNGIEYFAFWGEHEQAFGLFQKHGIHPQIWKTCPSPQVDDPSKRVKAAAESLLPLVQRTEQLGSKLGLYNHGGWGGEPENMIAVCDYLKRHHGARNVGIVYNLHHGHSHLDDFPAHLDAMKSHLLCLNLNGMTRDGDKHGKKILPIGEGEFDVRLLKAIQESRYEGPVGIIGHTQDDVEQRLLDNLDGLDWVLSRSDGSSSEVDSRSREKPPWRTYGQDRP